MSEFLIKVRKNIQNALKVQVATMHRSMQNPLSHSIHQSIGVVMDKFFELVAEESKSVQMKSFKICKTRKKDQFVPPTAHSECVRAFQIRKKVRWNESILISGAISIIYKFYNWDCSKAKIIKSNHLCLYDIQNDHI